MVFECQIQVVNKEIHDDVVVVAGVLAKIVKRIK